MTKKFKIVMLSANEKVNGIIVIDSFRIIKPNMFMITNNDYKHEDYKSHHLYIISDDEIKEGDWIIRIHNNEITKCINIDKNSLLGWEKVIATTDQSLATFHEIGGGSIQLPQLPTSFIQAYIKAYNAGKVITEVDLELECCGMIANTVDCCNNFKIKTRSDNTVIIHQSNTYTREQMIEAFRAGARNGYNQRSIMAGAKGDPTIPNLDQWIEKNL